MNLKPLRCLLPFLTFLVGIFFSSQLFAAGLTIPANCTVDVGSCAVVVPGDITNAGTLRGSSGSITLSGNWLNSGSFSGGTSTVTFNATSGTQTLDTGGLAHAFYNVTHNAAGTLQLAANPIDINNTFTNSAGTFVTSNLNMNVGKDWNNSAAFTAGTSVVTLDGAAQTMTGTTTFYDLTKVSTTLDTLTFSADGTDEQHVTHKLTLQGASGNLLSLLKSGANPQAELNLHAGGIQSLRYLDVNDNHATGLLLVAGATSNDGLNNTNWAFGNTTITWDGTSSTDWDDPFNWDLGLVPAAGDTVIIPPTAGPILYQPTLSTAVTIGNLTIQANAVVTLNGQNLTVSTAFANSGNLVLRGTETLTLTQDVVNPGTFTYVGTNTGATITIRDFGASDYYKLVINDPNATEDTFITNANLNVVNNLNVTNGTMNISTNNNALTVAGILTVDGGTLTATNGSIDANGNVVISSGTLTAPSGTGNTAFTVAGDWAHSGGTFTHSSGKVTFDGTSQAITGSSTFAHLRKVTPAGILNLESGATQTVTTDLTLSGAAGVGQLLNIVSSGAGQANLTLVSGGTQNITFVDVTNNNASGGVQLIGRSSSNDGGSNTNWVFGAATVTWDGSTSTDWDVATNWDKGIVPNSDDTAIIANAGNQPATLSTNVQLTALTINDSATVKANGLNLVVTGALTMGNTGTLTRFGNETVTFGTMDVAHGTFEYTGNGDGTVDVFTVTDYGATDYFNLVINDTNATPGNRDVFRTNGALTTAGVLTVSGGTLDISTNANALTTTGLLTVSGGVLTATASTIDANGVTVSSGTLTAPSSTTNTGFTVAGNWAHSGGTFSHSNGKVTFDGIAQTVSGDTTFYQLRKAPVGADTLTLTAGSTQTIVNNINLTGASTALLLGIQSSSTVAAKLNLQPGGTQTITNVDVANNDASGGLTLVARGSSNNGGNNTHWQFGAATVTWTGTTSTDWNTDTNWDLGLVPTSLDTAVIADTSGGSTNQPILAVDTTVTNLTVQANATLTLNGQDLTVTDTLLNDGTVTARGDETIEIQTIDPDSGTFIYTGTGAAATFSPQISDPTSHLPLADEFFNLTINDTSNTGTFLRGENLSVLGNLTISGGNLDISTNSKNLTVAGNTAISAGTLTATNGNIDANGALALSGTGTLVAPTTGKTFTIAGNFSHAAGSTFTHSNGRVTFDTAAAVTITGDTTFYDLFSTTPSKQFTFAAGSTQTVTHTFNFIGARGSEIVLLSSSGGTPWNITFPNSTQFGSSLTVSDSNANTNEITCLNCNNGGGNNTNWKFVELHVSAPDDDRTVGQTPVLIGVGAPNTEVRIRGKNEAGTEVIVATTVADINGNFRVILGQDDDGNAGTTIAANTKLKISLAAFDNYVTPYVVNPATLDEVPGLQNDLTVVASPTTDQVPVITSPTSNQQVSGDKPTFVGVGLAGQSVSIVANDKNGTLPLTTVGTGTVDGSGNYSVTITTALPASVNYVSIVVNGVSSDLLTITLTDPFGYVFDSSTNLVIKNATVSLYRVSDNQLAEKSICDSSGNITTLKDIACTDTNPYITDTDGFYSFLANPNNYYIKVSAENYIYPSQVTTMPAGRAVDTGSKGEHFTVATTVLHLDQPLDASDMLLRIQKDINKKEAMIGDIVTYTVTIQNLSNDNAVENVILDDMIPAGFKYVADRVLLDNVPIADPTGGRPLAFSIGTVGASVTKVLKYQLVVGSGVVPGTYENIAHARYADGVTISNSATKTIKIVMDPLFDLGSVLGKVFYDLNENGVQDAPEYDAMEGTTIVEKPVPNVQIVMEDGTVITTDQEGKFSVPGILPGRHILRVDERTLPPGTFLTTDKAMVIDVTKGGVLKANFGVNADNTQIVGKDAQFFNERIALTQDRNKPAPRLNAALFSPAISIVAAPALPGGPVLPGGTLPGGALSAGTLPGTMTTQEQAIASAPNGEELIMYNGMLVRQAIFRIFTNYSAFVDRWRLEIIDADTKKLVKRFEGTRYNLFEPVFWNGRSDDDKIIRSERKYSYILYFYDGQGLRDATLEKPLTIRVLDTEEQYKQVKENEADKDQIRTRSDDYRRWVDAQSAINNMDIANIPVQGETITINRQAQDIKSVRLVKEGALFAEVPVEQYFGLTPQELLAAGTSSPTRPDNIELIVPNGDYTLDVLSSGPMQGAPSLAPAPPLSGPPAPAVGPPSLAGIERYSRPLKVGDDYMLFVGMGDAKVGYNFNRGNTESVTPDDKFQDGFWQEGKAAYYLKGKILGKYLVTSSFDQDRQQKALFRQLDPDTYYPIYGDKSSINYDATNTQGPLYLLVEWDKSSAIWGNYAIDFNDTEFASFSRSYYGGKVDYQSVANNPYDDPRTKVVVFHAEVQQLPDHNEFLGTGGSLYFLKNKRVIEGSERIRIEVRDKITGLAVASRDMVNGADYELDDAEGRIFFWQPVSMIAKSESIVAGSLLDGNPVYVVADYQYEVTDKIRQSSEGARVAQGVGNNIVIGGTYVKETQANSTDYSLQGTDVTARLGPDSTIKAEYAETESVGSSTYVSTDGGITFTQLQTGSTASGRAYGITQDARLFDRVGLTSYYKWIGDSFSSPDTVSKQGKEMAGMKMTFDLTPETRLTASQDIQKLINNGNLQTQAQVGASETSTTLMQVVHDSDRLTLTGAYQINQVTNRIGDIVSTTNQVTRTLAGRAEYALNGRVTLTMGQQFDVMNRDNNMTTIGAKVRVFNCLMAEIQQAFSNQGTATTVGTTYNVTDKLAVSTAYTMAMLHSGQVDRTAAIAAEQKLSDDIITTGTVAVTDSSSGVQTATTSLATKTKINETTSLEGIVGKSIATDGNEKAAASLGARTSVGQDTNLHTAVALNNDGTVNTKSLSFDADHKIDEKNDASSSVTVAQDDTGNKTSTVGFANKTKINDELQAVREQSFGTSNDGTVNSTKYGVVRDKNGRMLEGNLTRQLGDSKTTGISRSNIFGLSGDVNDKLALQGSLEKGEVQNLDQTRTNRTAISGGLGYVWKDPETAMERLKDSAKVEFRIDTGAHAAQQYVFYNSLEGRVTENFSVSAKVDFSRTWSTESNQTLQRHREIVLGAAYRPVNFDNLNLIARYTAKNNQAPAGQVDSTRTDVEQTRQQVFAAEAIYDINENWQLAEKFAYRINDEKVTGFDFTRTHTWLMVNRINYRVDRNWTLGGEYRRLTQVEAKDSNSGYLMEATRNIGDNAQLGFGWNFTKFNDDLSNLSFNAMGPFIRMTGKLYDRTPEEKARARARWLDERVNQWAWTMVRRELSRPESKVSQEFNRLFVLAQTAQKNGDYDQAKQVYKEVVMGGQMMFDEAAEYIRTQIAFEEKLQEYNKSATDYFKGGEYVKARKLWEKIVEGAQKRVIE